MSDFEIRGREYVDCMAYFSEAKRQDRNFIYGGLFWTGNEEYIKNFSIILHRLINKEKPENLEQELKKVLSDPEYRLEGKAVYSREKVIWKKVLEKADWLSFFRYRKDERMKLVSGKVMKSGIDKRAGLVFLRILGIEGGPVDNKKVFEGRRRLIDIWERLTEKDHIKAYLAKVRLIGSILFSLYPQDLPIHPLILKLFGYMAGFDFKSFGDCFLLSRARLFWKKKKAHELLEEIESTDNNLWEDIIYALKQNGIDREDLLQFLQKLEDETFLRELRKDWKDVLKKLLKGKSQEVLSAFVTREHDKEAEISYGEFHFPSKAMKLFIFYENSLEAKVEDFVEGFKKVTNAVKGYIGNANVIIGGRFPIENLIYKFNELKRKNMDNLKHEDSVELLLSLMNFACRLKGLENYGKSKREMVGILLLLDTDIRQENGGYSFWDYFSFIYDFFGLPVQTLNKPTIEQIIEAKRLNDSEIRKRLGSLYKNLFISLLKDYKDLSFDFEGFDLPPDLKVYAILEKPSVSFCYIRGNVEQKGYRHFIYEIYQVEINGKTAKVKLLDKQILLTGGLDVERDRFIKWLEEKAHKPNTRFCFITARSWEESPLEELINQSNMSAPIKAKSLYVEYKELPTAYISSDKVQEDCFVIYTSEFEKLKDELGIKDDKHSTALVLKPAEPKARKEFELNGESYYHPSLQVFSTKGPGWEKNEVYAEKKSLFLFTVLALSFYESESFQTPYSKLDLWQKKKTNYLRIRRKYSEYLLPLNAVLYELLYLISKVPVEDIDIPEKERV